MNKIDCTRCRRKNQLASALVPEVCTECANAIRGIVADRSFMASPADRTAFI